MVMETNSLDGGILFPALMVPERLIDGVPAWMDCDAVKLEKLGKNSTVPTVMVAEAVKVALLAAVMVAVFERVTLVVVELVTCTLALIAGARLPIEQARIWAP